MAGKNPLPAAARGAPGSPPCICKPCSADDLSIVDASPSGSATTFGLTKQLILDKRSVVPLEAHDFDRWLTCTVDEAREMLLLPSMNVLNAGPASDGRGPDAEEAPEA